MLKSKPIKVKKVVDRNSILEAMMSDVHMKKNNDKFLRDLVNELTDQQFKDVVNKLQREQKWVTKVDTKEGYVYENISGLSKLGI